MKKKLPKDLKNASRIAINSAIVHHAGNLGGIVSATLRGYLERDGWEIKDQFNI